MTLSNERSCKFCCFCEIILSHSGYILAIIVYFFDEIIDSKVIFKLIVVHKSLKSIFSILFFKDIVVSNQEVVV